MTDYTSALSALETTISTDMVEEYEVKKDGFRTKRGSILNQIKAATLLEGLAHRRANGIFTVAKLQEPTD